MQARFVLIALLLGGVSLAQTMTPSATNPGVAKSSPSSGEFGSSAVWHPASGFVTAVHAACDKGPNPVVSAECFINQMEKAGAPQDALKFTRKLQSSNGQLGLWKHIKTSLPSAWRGWSIPCAQMIMMAC